MRRFSVPLTVMFVVVLGLLAPLRLSFVAAQEGTPSPEDELPPGITAEFIAGGAVSELPPTPASFFVLRLTLEPGAAFPAEPDDPSGAFIVVEAGTLTVRFEDSGTELTYGAGESFYGPPFAAAEVSNQSQDPVVVLLVVIGPEEGDAAATPAAS